MRIDRIDHIGIVVDDYDTAQSLLTNTFGLPADGEATREDLRTMFFRCGRTRLELIDVFDDDERTRRLQGVHGALIEHIAFVVPDLDESVAFLAERGITVTCPRSSSGFRSVWTDTGTTAGMRFQLMERLSD